MAQSTKTLKRKFVVYTEDDVPDGGDTTMDVSKV